MKLLRMGICALVAFGVLAHGGVENWARACIETGAGLLFVVWAVQFYLKKDQALVIAPLLTPLAALCLVVLGQIIFHSTVSGFSTQQEFNLLLADTVVVFLAVQVFQTAENWREFVWFFMIFGFLVCIFGILQHLTFNGKLYWFREMHYGGIPFGPYVNRNHFAGFAELAIPLSLVPLMLGKVRRERLLVVGLFAVVSIGALFLSASRGGIISFAVEVVVVVTYMTLQRTGTKQILAAAAVLIAALLMVSWLGVNELGKRFSTMQRQEVGSGKRAAMRRGSWRIYTDHPWVGTGLGTLQIVFPPYETFYDGRIVNHSHNDYLEALAETGILGGLCCALFLALLFFHSWRHVSASNRSFVSVLHFSGLVACLGFLVHSLVDFNLHLPANALLFLLMANLAVNEINFAEKPASRRA